MCEKGHKVCKSVFFRKCPRYAVLMTLLGIDINSNIDKKGI